MKTIQLQVLHIFAYLKVYDRWTLVFDDNLPDVDTSRFMKSAWSEFYPDAKAILPPNAPEPRVQSVVMTCFVDADHAG